MNRHEKHLENLCKIAEDVSPVGAARIAACLVHKNDIISYGTCSYKTSPFQKRYGKNDKSVHMHAEVMAIRNALKTHIHVDDLENASLYVARVRKTMPNGVDYICSLAKPCEGCRKAISMFNIKQTFYTTENGYEIL